MHSHIILLEISLYPTISRVNLYLSFPSPLLFISSLSPSPGKHRKIAMSAHSEKAPSVN